MALSEVSTRFVRQNDAGLHKRWFAADEADLTLWQEIDGSLVHFQFVVGGRDLIDWDLDRGLRVGRLESPIEGPLKGARTYHLTTAADPAVLELARREFDRQSDHVESGLKRFVLDAIEGKQPAQFAVRTVPSRSPEWDKPARGAARDSGLPVEFEAISIALLTPPQIRDALVMHAAVGFELVAIGANHAILQRTLDAEMPDTVYDIRSITLSLPHQIMRMLAEVGVDGQALGGIGPNFAFFKRHRNMPPEPRQFDMESVTILRQSSLETMLTRRGLEGWALTGMGLNFAFFERPEQESGGRTQWEHEAIKCGMRSFSASAASAMVQSLAEASQRGWRPCAASSSFVFVRRPLRKG